MNKIASSDGVGQSGAPEITSQASHFRSYADAGFLPDLLPIIPPGAPFWTTAGAGARANAGKIPGNYFGGAWTGLARWADIVATPEHVARWETWPNAGLGIHCRRVVAFDVDVEDARFASEIVEAARKHLGQAPVRTRGGTRRLLVYRLPPGVQWRKRRVAFTLRDDDTQHAVEFLGTRQQFVAEGMHRSGERYQWAGGKSPASVGLDGLTEVTPARLDEFITKLESALAQKGAVIVPGGSARAGSASAPGERSGVDQDSLRGNYDDVRRALLCIPNDLAYDDWIRMGAALKAAVGEEGRGLWIEWSLQYPGNTAEIATSKWDSLQPPFSVGADYIFTRAQPHGFSYAAIQFGKLPMPEGQVAGGRETRSAADAAVDALNREFVAVLNGGDFNFVRLYRDRAGWPRFAIMEKGGLARFYANKLVPVPDKDGNIKQVNPAKLWETSPRREEATGLVFRPNGPPRVDGALNLWRGWAVEPSASGSCERFKTHIREVLCGGRQDLTDYVLDFLADIVQGGRKPGIALAVRGKPGTGKSIVGEYFSRIAGPYHVKVAQPDHITGRFNAHLAHAVMVQADEAFFSGDKRAESVLKDLITAERQLIEKKGVDSFELENHVRVFATSNADWVVPAGLDDRRWCVLEASDGRKGDKSYFEALAAEMNGTGPARLLYELQCRKVDYLRLAKPPATAALVSQKVESLSLEEGWFYECAQQGWIGDRGLVAEDDGSFRPAGQEWPTLIPKDDFYAAYASYYERMRKGGYKVTKPKLRTKIESSFPPLRFGDVRPLLKDSPDGDPLFPAQAERPRCLRVPPLADVRRAIEDALGGPVDWDPPE
jgi:hypothetical protein